MTAYVPGFLDVCEKIAPRCGTVVRALVAVPGGRSPRCRAPGWTISCPNAVVAPPAGRAGHRHRGSRAAAASDGSRRRGGRGTRGSSGDADELSLGAARAGGGSGPASEAAGSRRERPGERQRPDAGTPIRWFRFRRAAARPVGQSPGASGEAARIRRRTGDGGRAVAGTGDGLRSVPSGRRARCAAGEPPDRRRTGRPSGTASGAARPARAAVPVFGVGCDRRAPAPRFGCLRPRPLNSPLHGRTPRGAPTGAVCTA